jgi:hypothetical protein
MSLHERFAVYFLKSGSQLESEQHQQDVVQNVDPACGIKTKGTEHAHNKFNDK